MNTNLKVSVIIPVYNVEKFIDRCLASVVNQTYRNLEIIIVDDGSPDNCPKICDSWALKDERIKVIHKKNAGLGMARNTGLDAATGDYVYFIDSDDTIDLSAIEACVNKLNENNFDVLYFGFKSIDINDNVLSRNIPTPSKCEYFNDEVKKELLPSLITDLPDAKSFNLNFCACMCLIKRSLIEVNKWRFVSERNIISEDLYSLSLLFKNVKSVAIVNEDFYSYRVNDTSLTHSYRKDRFTKLKELNKLLNDIYKDSNINRSYDYLFISFTIGCLKNIVSSNLSKCDKKQEIKKIINDQMLREMIDKFIKIEAKARRIYLYAIKMKSVGLVYILTNLQNKRGN